MGIVDGGCVGGSELPWDGVGLHSPKAVMCLFEKTAVHLLHWLCALPLPPAMPLPPLATPCGHFQSKVLV